MKTLIKFIGTSANKKTGCISQTYSSKNTCPKRCPFKDKGCYAKYGNTNIHWSQMKNSCEPQDLKTIIKNTPHTDVIRHNIAGDIAKSGTSTIDTKLLDALIDAYKGLKAYTYTHCTVNKKNIESVKKAITEGFVINFSVEDIKTAKKCYENNVPCVMAVNSMSKHIVKKEGLTFIQCPATYNKDIHCKNCGLCYKKNRKSIICFPAHGSGKNKIKDILIEL